MNNDPPPTDGPPPPEELPPTPDPVPGPDTASGPWTPPYPATAPYPGMVRYPEESQALLSLLMSILGLVVCSGLLCPVGWYLANKELEAINGGRRDPSKRDLAMAGKIVGIIGTVLLALGLMAFIGFIIFAVGLGVFSA